MTVRSLPDAAAATHVSDAAPRRGLVRNPATPSPLFIGWGPRLR